MPKQLNKKKPPKDINQLAAYIVKETTEKSEDTKSVAPPHKPAPTKNL